MRIHFKKIFILSLLTVSFSTMAHNDKEYLAQRCKELSENIISLVSSQGKKSCVEKLDTASMYLETAGESILDNNNELAKYQLDTAVFSLQYAELDNCNRYIQISHSKFEAQKIRNAL